jgi:hypothetical protein
VVHDGAMAEVTKKEIRRKTPVLHKERKSCGIDFRTWQEHRLLKRSEEVEAS